MRRSLLLILPLPMVIVLAAVLYLRYHDQPRNDVMRRMLVGLASAPRQAQIDCSLFKSQRPLVLLALGQSNAGNHGETGNLAAAGVPVQVMNAGICSNSMDPLPGATGLGSSIWSRLPAQLAALGIARPVVLQLLAVNASAIDDWVRDGAPIAQHLAQALAANASTGLQPALVLWQQGETDAKAGTTPRRYADQLLALAHALDAGGVSAPIFVALSTVCRSAPDAGLRSAIRALAARNPRFVVGPDTDTVQGRIEACHWSSSGREQAAGMWASAISGMAAHHLPALTP